MHPIISLDLTKRSKRLVIPLLITSLAQIAIGALGVYVAGATLLGSIKIGLNPLLLAIQTLTLFGYLAAIGAGGFAASATIKLMPISQQNGLALIVDVAGLLAKHFKFLAAALLLNLMAILATVFFLASVLGGLR